MAFLCKRKSRRELSVVRDDSPPPSPRKKLVAPQRRREGVYNRAADASGAFRGKEERRNAVRDGFSLQKKKPSRTECSPRRRGAPYWIRTSGLTLRRFRNRFIPCSTQCTTTPENPHDYWLFERTQCCAVLSDTVLISRLQVPRISHFISQATIITLAQKMFWIFNLLDFYKKENIQGGGIIPSPCFIDKSLLDIERSYCKITLSSRLKSALDIHTV